MLERRAAGLETCPLPRFLLAWPARPARRLRQGFRQHGAAAIELAAPWPRPPLAAGPDAADEPPRALQSGLLPSAFLLDFLYPAGTHALLRRLHPAPPPARDANSPGTAARNHCFTSSAHLAESHPPKPDPRLQATDPGEGPSPRQEAPPLQSEHDEAPSRLNDFSSRQDEAPTLDEPSRPRIVSEQSANVSQAEEPSPRQDEAPSHLQSDAQSQNGASSSGEESPPDEAPSQNGASPSPHTDDGTSRQAEAATPSPDTEEPLPLTASATAHDQPDKPDASGIAIPNDTEDARKLSHLLSRLDEELYANVWDLYSGLDDRQQQAFRPSVTIFLAKSPNVVQVGRVLSLFAQIPTAAWDDQLQAAGVLALVRSGHLATAIERFKAGLAEKGFSGGLGYIIGDFVAKKQWQQLVDFWLEYFTNPAQGFLNTGPNSVQRPQHEVDPGLAKLYPAHLLHLETIPDLAKLYFSFEKYPDERERHDEHATHRSLTSRIALRALRRALAEAALRQPCRPTQAAVILEIWKDGQLYQEYLALMVDRWNQRQENKQGLAMLPELYRKYRAFPDAKPSLPILRAVFELNYPANAAALEEILSDWHATWGELDQAGFESFLKFYARAGNVEAVRNMWARYVARYPEVLLGPRAFHSIMNVYAQTGNAEQAEQTMRTMTDEYGVMPDISVWNMLLKCYTRVGDYPRVLQCFEEIRQMSNLDSYSYAHLMAMAAKKGDLETVVNAFNQSQQEGVPVSKEMAMAVVTAYCRSDRLPEAEKICRELAERKRGGTSTATWNLLLYFNGIQGKLDKSYELLQAMKTHGVAWDRQTHETLLQALAKVDQIQPAYQLLRSAQRDRLFAVGPEHYEAVMAGAVRTGELDVVDALAVQMDKTGQPMTFNAQTALLEAAFRRAPTAQRTRNLAKELVTLLRALVPAAARGAGAGRRSTPGDRMRLKQKTQSIGRALFLLVELRDFPTAEALVNAYTDVFPEFKGEAAFPPDVASALMLGYLRDDKLREVQAMWDKTWKSMLARSQRPDGRGIFAAHAYDLCRPLGVAIKAFREAGDGSGLLATMKRVTAAGFRLTSSNWNMAVRYLAETNQWEPAMDWCERMLMPGWRGWKRSSQTLQQRRDRKNTRALYASRDAVFSLQKEWLRLRKLAAWSAEVSNKLTSMEKRHPQLHYAFITSDYANLPAAWVLPQRPNLSKAVEDMLRPLSYRELRVMKGALVWQLRMERSKRWASVGTTQSLFHVVTGGSGDRVRTEALRLGELQQLDGALEQRLSEAGALGQGRSEEEAAETEATEAAETEATEATETEAPGADQPSSGPPPAEA